MELKAIMCPEAGWHLDQRGAVMNLIEDCEQEMAESMNDETDDNGQPRRIKAGRGVI